VALLGKLVNHLPGNRVLLLAAIELNDGILWPTLNDNLTSPTVLFHRRRGDEDYLFTVIVGGTFAVILRVLRKALRSWR
jgi:hypothetical protein